MVEEGDFPIKNSKEGNLWFYFNLWMHLCILLFLRCWSGRFKRCVYQLCRDGFLTIATMQNVLGLDLLADHRRNPVLSVRYGCFPVRILDVYRAYAVLHGK